jgi:benzoyl-CoA reductase subunit C
MSGLIHLAAIPESAGGPPEGIELREDFGEFREAPDLESLLRLAKEVLLDPTLPTARAWKRSGGRVVGCFPVYTPQELVHSLGLLPLQLQGGGENVEITHADALLGSFLCSISKSTLEMALTGRFDALDGLVLPYICDVSRNLEGILSRSLRGTATHMLHLPQNFTSAATLPFLIAEYRRLLAKLERVAGRTYDPESLRASLALFNRQRALVRELVQLRRDRPSDVTLAESYLLVRLGGALPRELHVELLARALGELRARARKPRDALRIVLVGPFCEQPTLDLLTLLEESGCAVVGEELQMVHSWYGDVPTDGDPLARLAEAYLRAPVDLGVRATPTTKEAAILQRVAESRADGVIFLTAKFCEPALEDVVLYRRALEKKGLPYLQMEFEEKSTTYEQARLQVETFVESQLFD